MGFSGCFVAGFRWKVTCSKEATDCSSRNRRTLAVRLGDSALRAESPNPAARPFNACRRVITDPTPRTGPTRSPSASDCSLRNDDLDSWIGNRCDRKIAWLGAGSQLECPALDDAGPSWHGSVE